EDARVIALSAIGLVLATAAVVAVIGHELIGLPWAMSFALCAIVAPTDPAAATAIMRLIGALRKRVTDINTELTISLFSAYGAFVPADQLGVSGVLAVVACGVYLGFRAPEISSPESRMQAYSLWTTIAFLL